MKIEVYNSINQIVASRTGNGYWYVKDLGLSPNITYTFKLSQKGTQPAYGRIYLLTRNVFDANVIIGGLRIKTITTNDGDSDTTNNIVKNFEYKDHLISGRSSGKLVHMPIYVTTLEFWCTYVGDPDCDTTNTCKWPLSNANSNPGMCPNPGAQYILQVVAASSSLQPMQTTMGSHIGYLTVQV